MSNVFCYIIEKPQKSETLAQKLEKTLKKQERINQKTSTLITLTTIYVILKGVVALKQAKTFGVLKKEIDELRNSKGE